MANENKKINELVSDDDDPTAELDVASLREAVSAEGDIENESDAHTYGVGGDDNRSSRRQTIPELQQDLNRRTKTISRLQYDIEQLRAKWLGLETEIAAREEIVTNLNREVDELKNDVARKDKRLKKRNKSIKTLESELQKSRDEIQGLQQNGSDFEQQLADYRATESAQVEALDSTTHELQDVRNKLEAAIERSAALELEADEHKKELRSLEEQHAAVSSEFADLRSVDAEHVLALDKAENELGETSAALESAEKSISSLESDAEQRDEELSAFEQRQAELKLQIEEQRETITEQDAALDAAERDLEGLQFELETALNQGPPEIVLANITTSDAKEIQAQIARTEEYADTLRHKMQDFAESNSELARERDGLNRSLRQMTARNDELSDGLSAANTSIAELQASLELERTEMQSTIEQQQEEMQLAIDQQRTELQAQIDQQESEMQSEIDQQRTEMQTTIDQQKADMQTTFDQQQAEMQATIDQQQKDHDQEVRTLRFELDEAQNTVAQTTDMNSELATELVDTRGFKDELEAMLTKKDEQSQQRIEELEEQIKRLSRATEDFEQKLDTKSTAINVLLGELAKKSEQIDSIGEIEEVIQDIDDRMSGRIDDSGQKLAATADADAVPTSNERERITRVLVGSVDEQELRFPLFKDRLTIGRTHENDIQIKTSYVSRRHAVVLTEGDDTRVIDWGSKNGVFVNSKRVKERILSNGDIVSVGNAEFRYEERQKRDA